MYKNFACLLICVCFFQKAYCQTGSDKVLRACNDIVTSIIQNENEIRRINNIPGGKSLVEIDSISYYNDGKIQIVDTRLKKSRYTFRFYYGLKGQCLLLAYGDEGYERYNPYGVRQLFQLENKYVRSLSDHDYFKFVFRCMLSDNICVYQKDSSNENKPVLFWAGTWDTCSSPQFNVSAVANYGIVNCMNERRNRFLLLWATKDNSWIPVLKTIKVEGNYLYAADYYSVVGGSDASLGATPLYKDKCKYMAGTSLFK